MLDRYSKALMLFLPFSLLSDYHEVHSFFYCVLLPQWIASPPIDPSAAGSMDHGLIFMKPGIKTNLFIAMKNGIEYMRQGS